MKSRERCYPTLRGRVWGAAWFIGKGIFVLGLTQFYRLLTSSGASALPHPIFFFCMQHAWCKHPQKWSLSRAGAALPPQTHGEKRKKGGLLLLLLVGERVMAAGERRLSLPAFRTRLARAVWHSPRLEAGLSWGEGWAPAAGRTRIWLRKKVGLAPNPIRSRWDGVR